MARPRSPTATSARARQAVSTRAFVARVGLGMVLLRLIFVFFPLRSDEGGYLLVARSWHAGGAHLYGDYYVDRPPLLLAIFKLAALVEWEGAIRLVAIPFTCVFVVAAARTGYLLAGSRASRWAAVVAAALMVSPAVAADPADGELLAAPFVMAGVALTLEAWRAVAPRRRWWLAVAAGACAGAAPLVKQSFLEGLLFTVVLVLGTLLVLRRPDHRPLSVLAGFTAGAVVPHLLTVAWALAAGVGPERLWGELAGFRESAFAVIWSGHTSAPVQRGLTLVALAIVSGVLPLLATWAVAARLPRFAHAPVAWAVSAMLLYGLAAITAGGSYWPHYLLQLAPGLVVVAALGATREGRVGVWSRRSVRLVVGSAVVGVLVLTVAHVTTPWTWHQQRLGEWVASSGRPGDTAFVTYGNASVLEYAGMQSPYPHLWSLPMRTLDPGQAQLTSVLESDAAPTWIVEINGLNSWEIDADGSLRDVVDERYDVVARVCGNPVWLRADTSRTLAPLPRC